MQIIQHEILYPVSTLYKVSSDFVLVLVKDYSKEEKRTQERLFPRFSFVIF